MAAESSTSFPKPTSGPRASAHSTSTTMPPCKFFNGGKCTHQNCKYSHGPDKLSVQLRPGLPNICKAFLLYHGSCEKANCPYSHDLPAAGMPLTNSNIFCEIVTELRKLEGVSNPSKTRLLRLLEKEPKKPEKINNQQIQKLLQRRGYDAIAFSPIGPVICWEHLLGSDGCPRLSCSYSHDLSALNLETRSKFEILKLFDAMKKYHGNGPGSSGVNVYNVDFRPMSNGNCHDIEGLNGAEIRKYLADLPSTPFVKKHNSGIASSTSKVVAGQKTVRGVPKGEATAKKQAASKGPLGAQKNMQKTYEKPVGVGQMKATSAIKTRPAMSSQVDPAVPRISPKSIKKTPEEILSMANDLAKALEIESLEGLSGAGILDLLADKKREVLREVTTKVPELAPGKKQQDPVQQVPIEQLQAEFIAPLVLIEDAAPAIQVRAELPATPAEAMEQPSVKQYQGHLLDELIPAAEEASPIEVRVQLPPRQISTVRNSPPEQVPHSPEPSLSSVDRAMASVANAIQKALAANGSKPRRDFQPPSRASSYRGNEATMVREDREMVSSPSVARSSREGGYVPKYFKEVQSFVSATKTEEIGGDAETPEIAAAAPVLENVEGGESALVAADIAADDRKDDGDVPIAGLNNKDTLPLDDQDKSIHSWSSDTSELSDNEDEFVAVPKVDHDDGEVVGASTSELGAENRGRAMLEKMGWSKGKTLGVEGSNGTNSGLLVPIEAKMKIGGRGWDGGMVRIEGEVWFGLVWFGGNGFLSSL